MISPEKFFKKVSASYAIAIVYLIALFLTIPFVRSIQRFVCQEIGKSFFGFFVLGFIACFFVLTVLYLRPYFHKKTEWNRLVWILIVTAVYIYFTIKLWKRPEEAIHFLEYGFLSYLLFMALSHHIRDATIYLSVSFIVLFAGTLDEIIQWIVPARYWDSRDVWLNFIAGGLFQIAIWKGIRPGIINTKVSVKSMLILSSIIAACLLLIMLGSPDSPSRTQG
jgi:hypothetical protein